MPTPESLISAIDASEANEVAAQAKAADLITIASKLVTAVAANEVTYELAASANLSEEVSLTDIAEATETSRTSLNETIEAAILASKEAFRAKHEQHLLRAQLLQDVNGPEA